MTDDILTPADVEAIRTRVRALLPTLRNDLEDLSRIPSVSLETLEGYDQAHGPKGLTSRSSARAVNRR